MPRATASALCSQVVINYGLIVFPFDFDRDGIQEKDVSAVFGIFYAFIL